MEGKITTAMDMRGKNDENQGESKNNEKVKGKSRGENELKGRNYRAEASA